MFAEIDDEQQQLLDFGHLKIGDNVILMEQPCSVCEFRYSFDGRFGVRKVLVIGRNLFTDNMVNEVMPYKNKIKRADVVTMLFEVIDVTENELVTIREEDQEVVHLDIDMHRRHVQSDVELIRRIKSEFQKGVNAITISVISSLNESRIASCLITPNEIEG